MRPREDVPADSKPRRVSSFLLRALVAWALPALAIVRLAGAQTITEYPVPTPDSVPLDIVAGPDGNLWFTEYIARTIGRITADGVVTEYLLQGGAVVEPYGIAAGSDGNLWFTLGLDAGSAAIGRITPNGVLSQYPLPDGSEPAGIAAGSDGALWILLPGSDGVGRMTTSGALSTFRVPTASSGLTGIAAGPDGNLWFTELDANRIGRVTPAGAISEFPIPTAGSQPGEITAGPDGNVWFTELDANQIGRITPAGVITEFPIPTPQSSPDGNEIVAGPDGNLWFTENRTNKIGRITPSGVVSEFAVPTLSSAPSAITVGPDGNLWFTEETGNAIGRITTGRDGPCVPDDHTLCLRDDRFSVAASFRTSLADPLLPAAAVKLTADSGYFWFFAPDNVELVVKVVGACIDPFQAHWFFAAGMTNVEVQLVVADRHTGESKAYSNALGTPFRPIQDTSTFAATCP